MTAELVRGQNHPLPSTRLEVRVSAGSPVVAGVALADEQGTVRDAAWVAHPGAPRLPGVEVPRQAASEHRLDLDLDALPGEVHRVTVLLALPRTTGAPTGFGAVAAPFVSVSGPGDTGIADFTLTGLDMETAVGALEFYRRSGAWKVRAVGQGYSSGLAGMLADQGLSGAGELAASILETATGSLVPAQPGPVQPGPVQPGPAPSGTAQPGPAASGPAAADATVVPPGGRIDYAHPRRRTAPPAPPTPQAPPTPPAPPTAQPAAPSGPPAPVAGDAAGHSMDERLYNQVWGMFEDLARSVAAYRGAVDFAEARLEEELDRTLSDPRNRIGAAGDTAREAARAKRDELVGRAREVLDRDLAQLAAESEVVEPALPAPCADWDQPAWHAPRTPSGEPWALRLGDVRLPERPELRIPLLVRLPLERGLWIDSGRGDTGADLLLDGTDLKRLALESAVAHAVRLLAAYPAGEMSLQAIDPAGTGAAALAPLIRAGVLAGPPAAGAAGVDAVLDRLTRRVDLVQMAVRAGAADALPPDLDPAGQLLLVNDFPHGFDDRAVTRLRYLAEEGPSVGVHLLLVADQEEASAYGPLLTPFWRGLLRLTPLAGDHLADPWVRHVWTYEPPRVPQGSRVLEEVLAAVAEARRARGR
ncbi:TerD family protein [Streptomyces sp. NBC_00102]|uniref:TerD family protein n=1 Tax=Streptomyces sp. NBC_00102 TaxID=2975652 RepID=UPI00224ECA54|nr:TerD family protein [Streptomyces sp. NBC_00102]MCX5396363.1 TerD family protein [Streptomyces sp. NBC_00102]